MKIAYVTSAFEPGYGYDLPILPMKQAELGHEVHIIAGTREHAMEESDHAYEKCEYDHEGVHIHKLDCLVKFKNITILKGLKERLSRIKPDIVVGIEPSKVVSLQPLLYRKEFGYKYVLKQHWYALPDRKVSRFEYLNFRRHLCNLGFKKADAITAATPLSKEFLVDAHSLDEDTIKMIPIGANADTFKFNKNKRREFRKKLNIDDDCILIISGGQINRLKRLEELIKRFAVLSLRHRIKLLLVGGGDRECRAYLKCLSAKLGVFDEVIFIKRVPQEKLVGYYSASDIAIFPHRATISIPEAMACGLPIIIPDTGSMNHYVKEHLNGVLFEPENFYEMGRVLDVMILSKEMRMAFGRNSLKAVNETFNYDTIAKQYLELFGQLTKQEA